MTDTGRGISWWSHPEMFIIIDAWYWSQQPTLLLSPIIVRDLFYN